MTTYHKSITPNRVVDLCLGRTKKTLNIGLCVGCGIEVVISPTIVNHACVSCGGGTVQGIEVLLVWVSDNV